MFRELRRKNKEISIDESLELLRNARRGVLAINGDDGYPYGLPINFYYDESDGRIYFHGSKAGYKNEALRACEKVCFTIVGEENIKEESWAPFLESVIIFGKCYLMEDGDDALAKLKDFAMKFYPIEELVDWQIDRLGQATQMYYIEIEHMTGKEVKEK